MPLDYPSRRSPSREVRRWGQSLLDRVGLTHRIDHVPSQMSGGQQQRVAIARALVNCPALVLADEPTGNLDSHTSVEILRMFQELNAEGITVVLVTHDPKVAAYAHRTIHMEDGRVQSDQLQAGAVSGRASGSASRRRNGTAVDHAASVGDKAGLAVRCPPERSQGLSRTGENFSHLPHGLNALRRNKMRSALTALGVRSL